MKRAKNRRGWNFTVAPTKETDWRKIGRRLLDPAKRGNYGAPLRSLEAIHFRARPVRRSETGRTRAEAAVFRALSRAGGPRRVHERNANPNAIDDMVREFEYLGETFRVNAHGVPGHEEVFIIHLVDGEEEGEISIDRMTEENDRTAPLESIIVMLCDKLIEEREVTVADPKGAFAWREGRVLFNVHNGVQDHA